MTRSVASSAAVPVVVRLRLALSGVVVLTRRGTVIGTAGGLVPGFVLLGIAGTLVLAAAVHALPFAGDEFSLADVSWWWAGPLLAGCAVLGPGCLVVGVGGLVPWLRRGNWSPGLVRGSRPGRAEMLLVSRSVRSVELEVLPHTRLWALSGYSGCVPMLVAGAAARVGACDRVLLGRDVARSWWPPTRWAARWAADHPSVDVATRSGLWPRRDGPGDGTAA